MIAVTYFVHLTDSYQGPPMRGWWDGNRRVCFCVSVLVGMFYCEGHSLRSYAEARRVLVEKVVKQ